MRKIEVIISKQTVSEGFYIMIRGHFPNPSFKSIVSERQTTYKDAFWLAKTVCRVVSLMGDEAVEMNDRWVETDGRAFCSEMAFEQLPTWDGKDRE